jgi:hypothetical protein
VKGIPGKLVNTWQCPNNHIAPELVRREQVTADRPEPAPDEVALYSSADVLADDEPKTGRLNCVVGEEINDRVRCARPI